MAIRQPLLLLQLLGSLNYIHQYYHKCQEFSWRAYETIFICMCVCARMRVCLLSSMHITVLIMLTTCNVVLLLL